MTYHSSRAIANDRIVALFAADLARTAAPAPLQPTAPLQPSASTKQADDARERRRAEASAQELRRGEELAWKLAFNGLYPKQAISV